MITQLTNPARFPRASKDEKRALLDTTASEGGVSIYVHRVRCENHVMPVERDWIPATKLQEFEARQKLVAEFHFVNTGMFVRLLQVLQLLTSLRSQQVFKEDSTYSKEGDLQNARY